MLNPAPDADNTIDRYESLVIELTTDLLSLDRIVRRLATTDSASMERDVAWGRGLSDSIFDRTRQIVELELALTVLRDAMNIDQIERLQRSTTLHRLVAERWNEMQSDLLDAAASTE